MLGRKMPRLFKLRAKLGGLRRLSMNFDPSC